MCLKVQCYESKMDSLWIKVMYIRVRREVGNSRTTGIFIRETACFHCCSVNCNSLFSKSQWKFAVREWMKICRMGVNENVCRTGVRTTLLSGSIPMDHHLSRSIRAICWISITILYDFLLSGFFLLINKLTLVSLLTIFSVIVGLPPEWSPCYEKVKWYTGKKGYTTGV